MHKNHSLEEDGSQLYKTVHLNVLKYSTRMDIHKQIPFNTQLLSTCKQYIINQFVFTIQLIYNQHIFTLWYLTFCKHWFIISFSKCFHTLNDIYVYTYIMYTNPHSNKMFYRKTISFGLTFTFHSYVKELNFIIRMRACAHAHTVQEKSWQNYFGACFWSGKTHKKRFTTTLNSTNFTKYLW